MNTQQATCDACGTVYEQDDLAMVDDFFMRTEPGQEIPAGQCPDSHCGALCYLTTLEKTNGTND